MPNLPHPYVLRDWKKVAIGYDSLVFDISKTGAHLPLTTISASTGINYPDVKNIRMDTYVGHRSHGSAAEAIAIMPAIVGASLLGVDKTTHFNVNWVVKTKDFYNKRNGQNVYLNGYSAGTGGDWWYETMPNIFFYQLLSLYPTADSDFHAQLTTVANRQLEVVFKLGGSLHPWQAPNMNYRAFNLLTGVPNATGVPEPEAAGAIAWILYQAYVATGKIEYRQGAELALHFLNGWTRNPSYEIQLPYGIAAAARMNAVEGTSFDLEKLLRWAFSPGAGTLRGWGAIVGSWGGYEMSGLIGEANDRGNDYAFSMNGFQHAAALAPVAKYDKRYARAIAKWILNLASASRYFYSNSLPQANQDSLSYAWSQEFDKNAYIPYESIKESWGGVKPLAMGDAVGGGWAATNLSLYSGSSVGYLAALVDTTSVSGILQVDLNKTDFRGENVYPAYLYYNPHDALRTIAVDLPAGAHNVYDAISETLVAVNASKSVTLGVGADSVLLLVIYPTGSVLETSGRIMRVHGGGIVDYHHAYDYSNPLRIRALTSDKSVVESGSAATLVCQAENVSALAVYKWYVNGDSVYSSSNSNFSWTAANGAGSYEISCKVSDAQSEVSSQVVAIKVVDVETSAKSAAASAWLVYPNPVMQHGFTITAPSGAPVSKVEILSITGRVVWTKSGVASWPLHVSIPLSSGLYIVKVTSAAQQIYTAKIVKY
ncbi:MAG: T9SS type A sorting domain-containing protein [Prevotellaceae bacterium]|jgi:hypothetical protein|nr:T9SS type A sorting domain-containing protein [Prevotellaceae bacterium]